MTQEKLVLTHLKRHRTITPMQAWSRYSITRLADVVHKLRRHGHSVLTEPQRTGRTTYAKYRLV
jgi:hypothetical protein